MELYCQHCHCMCKQYHHTCPLILCWLLCQGVIAPHLYALQELKENQKENEMSLFHHFFQKIFNSSNRIFFTSKIVNHEILVFLIITQKIVKVELLTSSN